MPAGNLQTVGSEDARLISLGVFPRILSVLNGDYDFNRGYQNPYERMLVQGGTSENHSEDKRLAVAPVLRGASV